MPSFTIIIIVFAFIVSCSIPVTNDLIAKESNCAHTLKSTSEDMSKFCKELMLQYNNENGVLKEMFRHAIDIDNKNSWGLGIGIETVKDGETYWHSGINPGFQSLFVLYPNQNKYVIALTNSDNGLDFSKDVARTFLGVDGNWDIKR